MTLPLPPDIKGLFTAWAKSQSDLTTIVPTAHIRGTLPTAQDMPTFWLTCVKVGGYGSHPSLPWDAPRLDIWSYGPSGYEAHRLARTVRALLIPVARGTSSGIVGFTVSGYRVLDVQDEGGTHEGVTTEGWPFIWQSFIFRICEVPVS